MRIRTVLIFLLSFAAGGAAAWRIHSHPAGASGLSASEGTGGLPEGAQDAGKDTASAWRVLLKGGGQGISDRLLQADLVSRATVREMPRLLELAGKDQVAREMLLRRWAALDPVGAAAWLEPLLKKGDWPGPEDRRSDVEIVFSFWAKTDPAAALAELRAGASVGNGILWTGDILTRLLNEDMAAGVRLGGLTGSTMDLTQAHWAPSRLTWVQRDPVKAAALLSTLPPGDFRDRGLHATISALAKTDLAAAIALQERFPRLEVLEFDQNARNDFYKAWAGKDLPSLMAFLNDKAAEKDQPALKAAIALNLGERDPRSALDWTAANLSGGLRTETVEKILGSLTRSNPDAALAYLDSLSPGTALNSAVETFAKSLPDSDPAALLAKAETLPEGEARKAITAKAYGQMYEKNPMDMLQNLASQPPASLPDGLWRQLGETTGDIDAGISRLAALPPEAAPDFVRGLFQRNIGWDDFPKFSRIMGSLSGPENRAAAIEAAMPRLLHHAARVTEWAQSLPPAERSQVADQMEKHIYNLTDTQRRELITPLR